MNLIDYGRKKWDYLLKANFGGANSGAISNGTSIESVSSGSVQAGTLNALDSGAGTVSVTSNKLRIDPDSAVSWLVGVTSVESYPRANGLALKVRVDMSAGLNNTIIGFHSDNTPLDGGGDGHVFFDGLTDGQLEFSTTQLATLISGEMDVAIILGGYLSLVPWDGAATGYVEGANVFYKESGNWILKYKRGNYTATPLYFGMRVSQTNPVDIDNIAIPNADLSHLLKPLVLDTFTDTNGTALTAHTPDVDVVGGGWVAANGSWEIQSNKAEPGGSSPGTPQWIAYIEANKSDVFVEYTFNQTSSVNGSMGALVRYSDNSNFWLVSAHQTTGNDFSILERSLGSWTSRASIDAGIAYSTTYRFTIVANGQTIKAWVNDGNGISYTSATHNQSETKYGMRGGGDGTDRFDNFAVYPIGTNGEYSDLDRY